MSDRFTVIKDTREKAGQGWWYDEDEYCLGTVQTKVEYGDYVIEGLEDKFTIERKASVSEIATNIHEARFKRELKVLEKFPHKLILLEFDWYDIMRFPEGSDIPIAKQSKIKVRGNYIMSFLAEIQLEYGIPVIAASNRHIAEKIAYTHLKKVYKKYETSI